MTTEIYVWSGVGSAPRLLRKILASDNSDLEHDLRLSLPMGKVRNLSRRPRTTSVASGSRTARGPRAVSGGDLDQERGEQLLPLLYTLNPINEGDLQYLGKTETCQHLTKK